MNFNLSEEQVMLKDSVARYVLDNYAFEARRQYAALKQGFSADNWQSFAELGWLSIPFDEQHGGFSGGAVEVMIMMEEMGRGLVVEPYLATVLLYGGLISRLGNAHQQSKYIPEIIEGKTQGAFAYLERQSRFERADISTRAVKKGDNFVLNGEKTVVFNGAAADRLIVSARTSGEQSDKEGISLLLVDADTAGIEKKVYRLMDGQLVANICFRDVEVSGEQLLGECGEAYPLMNAVINEVIVALSAEAVGIMQKLNDTTIEYTKTRKQFGVAIGSFQALQHRMVDMFMGLEQTRSLLYRAVCSMDEGGDDVERNILALKVMVGRVGKLIGTEAIQLHGGMGITDELDVGHYVKRLMMINTSFGDADYQQQLFIKNNKAA